MTPKQAHEWGGVFITAAFVALMLSAAAVIFAVAVAVFTHPELVMSS